MTTESTTMRPKPMDRTTVTVDMPTGKMDPSTSQSAMPTMTMPQGMANGGMALRTMEEETPRSDGIRIMQPGGGVADTAVVTAAPTHPHVFVLPGQEVFQGTGAAAQVGPGAVGFDYPATLRGSTTHFHVYYDPSLGTNGQTLADGVLASCEAEYNILVAYFGGLTPA